MTFRGMNQRVEDFSFSPCITVSVILPLNKSLKNKWMRWATHMSSLHSWEYCCISTEAWIPTLELKIRSLPLLPDWRWQKTQNKSSSHSGLNIKPISTQNLGPVTSGQTSPHNTHFQGRFSFLRVGMAYVPLASDRMSSKHKNTHLGVTGFDLGLDSE